nr:immunoglobulin light chain junction region [Macaca mulatta]MOW08104.1 immunoglobulin light chain junction region [Macaca mulatta]MOW08531.1 immunoglobulin light chain junction region [Macaca mulatta]
CQETSHLYSF